MVTRLSALVVGLALVLIAAPVPPASAVPDLPTYGVASIATLADRTPAGYAKESAAIRQAGASWIRIYMNWNETEPWPRQYQWQRLDNAVLAAKAQGLTILGLLAGPAPAWAGAYPGVPGSPPRSASDYAQFAAAAAQRYRDYVDTWEIWNEPNLQSYWIAPNPSAYAALLKATYPRIKAANPAATVITGGVSSHTDPIEAVDFVRRVYAVGAGQYLDGVGVHPYTFPFAMGEDPHRREQMIPRIRAIMDAAGHAGKKIWVTEWGQPTGTGSIAVSEADQATMTLKTLRYLSGIPRLGPVFLYTSKDWKPDLADMEFNLGLYRFDYTPKPVVAALLQAG